VGVQTPELFRSSVVALRFTKDESSTEQAVKELRGFLSEAAGGQREAAFWADDSFLQSLHPVKDAWDRVFHLSHYGGIRLNPEKDRDWVLKRLADMGGAAGEREMMLHAAMIELLRPGEDPIKVLESLKPYVADAPALQTIIESRMKPAPGSEELRRFDEESRRRKQESQDKQAQARTSWVDFWREIATNPKAVFEGGRADNTAWNLWNAMERSGRESRASGWSRRFIEEQFGREVADRLRATLQRTWRKDKPTLRSERAAEEKNRFLVKWQLGLAAIYAEAEDPQWATKLTADEAQLAARYAPIELNGFPAWLDALVAAHPKAVDAILGEELTRSLRESDGLSP
jgi:hypothetical protein